MKISERTDGKMSSLNKTSQGEEGRNIPLQMGPLSFFLNELIFGQHLLFPLDLGLWDKGGLGQRVFQGDREEMQGRGGWDGDMLGPGKCRRNAWTILLITFAFLCVCV